jgi:hypothetical protein
VDEGKEVDSPSVVARGDPSEVLELVEAAFDAIARLVTTLVEAEGCLRVGFEGTTGLAPGASTASRKAWLS